MVRLVPNGTSYINQAFLWPELVTSNIVRFNIINNQPLVVHHMLLFKCSSITALEYQTPTGAGPMTCTSC